MRRCARLIRSAEGFKNAIVFCNRKREVALLHRSLLRHKFNATALHGDMDQSARTAALESFRNGEVTLLIASDVAARGLDIPAVSHIFNFDVPHHPDDYVHRIGRTGRAGLSGTAITLVAPIDTKAISAIEKLIGQPIPWSGAPAQPEPRGSSRPEHGGHHRGGGDRHRGERQHRPQGQHHAPHGERKHNEPRHSEPRHSEAKHGETKHAPQATRPAEPRKAPREPVEGSDASHLPAFLLRPVPAKA